ncbi:MAG: hypothetical protein KBC17_02010 [Candidatus Pacebacteria bacterium]|nr:hypothetical protein [Candidatus Paceibacterota bacterium]
MPITQPNPTKRKRARNYYFTNGDIKKIRSGRPIHETDAYQRAVTFMLGIKVASIVQKYRFLKISDVELLPESKTKECSTGCVFIEIPNPVEKIPTPVFGDILSFIFKKEPVPSYLL